MEQRRTIVGSIRPTAGRERRACQWLGFHRSAVRSVPDHRADTVLRATLRDLADAHPRWGAPMRLWKLRQEGILDNHKRVRRWYRLDSLGNITRMVAAGMDRSFAVNPYSGQLQSVASADGDSLTFGYAGPVLGSLTWNGRVAGTVRLGYTSDLTPAYVGVDGGQYIDYRYLENGRLDAVGGLIFSYDSVSGLTTGTALGSVAGTWQYDSLGQVTTAARRWQESTVLSRLFGYDRLGRIDSVTEISGTDTVSLRYGYGKAGRLVTASRSGIMIAGYEYDANGNRVRETTASGTLIATYDERDRLLTYGDAVFTYSPNGERLTRQVGNSVTRYTYNALGHLTRVALPDGRVVTYEYDPAGHRIGRLGHVTK